MKVILTGATGFVGEGVLLTMLEHRDVTAVLSLVRRPSGMTHAKLKELVLPDFMKLSSWQPEIKGYDACFYCAGVSSAGMSEADYTAVTYETCIHVAEALVRVNPEMIMCHVSGASTDEKSRQMWARVKGKTESALMKLPFKAVYNFRPGFMNPIPGQTRVKSGYRFLAKASPLMLKLFPNSSCEMRDVGLAMIVAATRGTDRNILEVRDIKSLAAADAM